MTGRFQLADWQVDPPVGTVGRGDQTVTLEPKVMEVLVYLAHHPDEVLPKERILTAVWSDSFVTDDVLLRAISELRKVFSDDPKEPRIIATLPRRGYRLIAPVSWEEPPGQERYRLGKKIGQGATGEVYLAQDSSLNRKVALKFLREDLQQDPLALRRFEREARAAAAVDHPYLCKVYETGRLKDKTYIALEYVVGETLKEKLSRGPLPLGRSVEIVGEIAEGLSKAHQVGIVHRDLKPSNLVITGDGHVKIMDFGLARRMPWAAEDVEQTLSREGSTQGTIAYMSPEQARGERVDARADIFSLGIIFYEMLTGENPFRRATALETAGAVLKEDPPPVSEGRSEVPERLGQIIGKMLSKEPERRYQTASEIRAILAALPDLSAPQPAGISSGRSWKLARGFALGLMVVAALWAVFRYYPVEPDYPPPRVIPLTTYPGREWAPALSPDGNQLAFTRAGESGEVDNLYVKTVGGGEPLLVSPGSGGAAWSPDGVRIAFFREIGGADGEPSTGIFIVFALGGREKLVATSRGGTGLAWSPDGELLAFSDKPQPNRPARISLLSLATGETQRLRTGLPDLENEWFPSFSPDGKTLAFLRGSHGGADIYLMAVKGGEERRLTSVNTVLNGFDWAQDRKSIVFSAHLPGRAGQMNLWRVSTTGGEPEPLEFGEEGYYPTVARQGTRLAYLRAWPSTDIWRIPGPSAAEEARVPARFISTTSLDYMPSYSPDGREISFTSSRSGNQEVWVCDSDGSNPRQLTFFGHPMTVSGSWSPDGKQIAFTSRKEGNLDVYSVSVAAGFLKQLTTEISEDAAPSWSRDGRWIYFVSDRSGAREVWRISAGGAEPIQVTHHGGARAVESVDGRFLYFDKGSPKGGPPGLWRMPVDGGEEVQVHDKIEYAYWNLLQDVVCYINRETKARRAIETYAIATGEVKRLAVLPHRPMRVFSVSPDGRWILYSVQESKETDIMLVENFR